MNKTFKIFCCCAAAATAAAGCDDSEKEYDPGIKFSKTGDVTLVAAIENCDTRASLVGTGEARWLSGDAISVICTDGTAVEFPLNGTGNSRKAFFSGTIPAGKEMGSYALYPVSATLTGNTVKVELPGEITPSPTGSCSLMAAEIGNSCEIEFKQLMSYLTVQLGNVSSEAVKIELTSDKSLSGEFTATLPGVFATGVAAQEGSDGIVITLTGNKETTVTAGFAVPVGEYGNLTAVQYDSNGKNIGETECLTAPHNARLAGLRSISATLPKYAPQEPIDGTALVAGIYWALGNLQHVAGSTDEGFQTDWRIAPDQWEYINFENAVAAGTAVTFLATDYTKYDHFNWGGIQSPYDNVATSPAAPAVGTDISGKMYTSQNCTAATTDYTEAKFGDLAYWASKGRFRMPTTAEIKKLLDEADCQYGSYKIADGKYVTGLLYTNAKVEGSPVTSDTEVELTAADIAKGLFLPKGGRRYNAQAFTVNVQGTQGTYWTSESMTFSAATDGFFYGTVFHIVSAKASAFPYTNAAFDSKAGFMIRPVYIAE